MSAPENLILSNRFRCFDGWQHFYRHAAQATACEMRFGLYLPPQAEHERVPLVIYLAGLTCNEETFPIKAGAQRVAAELGLALLSPDTSPRGVRLPGDDEAYDFGLSAGFYLDATEAPWSAHYRMYSYVARELPDLVTSQFPVDAERIGCVGVSLGGHNSLFVGVFDTRLKVMVSSSGFDSFSDYMGGNLSGWCQPRYMMRIQEVYGKDPKKMPFDFPEGLAALAPRYLYVHAPLDDSNFRVESAKRCVEAAAEVYRLFGANDRIVAAYPPGKHGFPIEAREASYRFIDGVLKPTAR